MKIAIIEDEKAHSQLLESYIQSFRREEQVQMELQYFESAENFLFVWEEEHDFDLLFLDIQMAGMDGMSLAKQIRCQNEEVMIVFTTGISDYMQEGYEVEALQYLLKPLKEENVHKCLSRALAKRPVEDFLVLHTEEETLKLTERAINYIEARGHGSCVGIAYQRPIEVKESLSAIEQMLKAGEFIKCHRSYICRLGNVHHIDKDSIYFDDGSSIPVSRRQLGAVNQAFIRYYAKINRDSERL